MDLDEFSDGLLRELGVKDFHCLDCGTHYSADENSPCPMCGSDNIELL